MSTQAEAAVVEMTYRDAINAAMDDAMALDDSVILMGEDVNADGGVFKTNAGLPQKYGDHRVFATPICENGFTNVALGMSLTGLRPIVEFMFADFMPTAGDAIVNQLPKYRYMSGGQFAVPVTLRVVSGGGGRFGTQHSATGESWYMSQPGMHIAVAGSPGSAYGLLRAAIACNDPVIVHEHKALYARKGPVERGTIAEIGKAAVLREGTDVTIVSSLLMVERALAAADTLGEAPPAVIDVGLRAAQLIGNGLYGVDIKETAEGLFVVEVNDNPNIEHGIEDAAEKDQVWIELTKWFIDRLG